MKASKIAGPCCVSVVLLFAACTPQMVIYEHDISSSTRAIESARDDAHRAAAYSRRGSAYSEKARYSRAFKLIPAEEYERLFGLAIKDHEQAIALDPTSAEAYYNRGRAYYDRAELETVVNGSLVGTEASRRVWFAPAAADFEKAIQKNGKYSEAWDMLGMSHETTGELDLAIAAYTQEMALNRLGKMRLAEAYCERGGSHHKEKQLDAAIADYEKSIDLGADADGCSCDPYNPLLVLYSGSRRYDQGWVVVRRALKAGKWLEPEFLNTLKKESGRSN
jgi:tetratricopeptide (TPR) repeat protein